MSGGDTSGRRVKQQCSSYNHFDEQGPRPPTLPGQEQEPLYFGMSKESGGVGTVIFTPRKSNLHGFKDTKNSHCMSGFYKTNAFRHDHYEGVMEESLEGEPPLGYEPEGSASACGSPPFSESRTPSYLKWAQALEYLLCDIDGIQLFRRYLSAESCNDHLEFWFACEGLKKQPADQIQQLSRLIYRKYLRQNTIPISVHSRKCIHDRLYSKVDAVVDTTIFDKAKLEIEQLMSNSTYPNFLKSDIYLNFVQSMQNGAGEDVSSKNGDTGTSSNCCSSPSSRSSNCGGRGDATGLLPTVLEDSELNVSTTLSLTSNSLLATQRFRAGYSDVKRPEAYAGLYLQQGSCARPVNPYHAMYSTQIPGSAQDSELQSLSSDAHTDETVSHTDSSLSGRSGVVSRKYLKQQHRAMKQNACQNYDSHHQYTMIPRTERVPVNADLATKNPNEFADVLIKKLDDLKKSFDLNDKINESLNSVEHEPVNKDKVTSNQQQSQCTPLKSLLTAAMAGIENDNEQSILDEHVSRIWQDSVHQTPTLTPGHQSPLPVVPCPKSPERRRASAPPVLNPYANKPYSFHRHRKERDLVSTVSGDSGAIPDFVEGESSSASGSEFFHFHPKYSHHISSKLKGMSLGEAGTSELHIDLPQRRSKETGKRASSKKCFMDSSSSGIDSGVSLANEPNQQTASSLNSKDKVATWVMRSDKYYSSHSSDTEKDSTSRHKRSNYSSLSAASPAPNRQGKGKKQIVSSRSGSQERSGHSSWSISGAQPGQPIMGDPSMPMLPPPNTTTQLEEARRRLEDDTKSKLLKSKSSGSSKDRMPHLDLAKGGRVPLKSPINSVAALDYFEDGSHSKKSTKKCSSSNPSLVSTPVTPVAPDIEYTVVGYQFSGDDVPYRSKLPGKNITLKQFKTLITKKGNFKYFFKKADNEFGTGIVYDEFSDDNDVLPLWEGKLFAKLEMVD
ncbi:hypothetical protein CHUAL_013203 [Chamberlinius hualienensis]